MDSLIKLEHINFWYDKGKPSELWALKDVSLEIGRGEYAAFFGPSGSGKTTLLYLIAGVEQSQQGKIFVNSRDIGSFSKQELAIYRQVGVGMIFQQFNLIPSLSVLNNVALPMSFLGISSARARNEAMRLLERLDIKELADRLPFELSGGQQQRVGVARALANNPPIIIADEPLGNLDSTNAQRVLEFLKELNEKDGRTIIMVTHEAWSLKDVKRIFYVKDGAVVKTEESQPKTIAESLSQHLYEQLSPELTKSEVVVRSLASMLLRGYSLEEIKRFEYFLSQRFAGHIDGEVFRGVLDRPFREGGVGLWKQKAFKVSRYVEDILTEKKEVEEVYTELERNPESPLKDEVERIRAWLLEGYHGTVNELQQIQIDELISDRLRNVIGSEAFRKILNLPKKQYGVGLPFRATQRISEKLELVLARGEKRPAGSLQGV